MIGAFYNAPDEQVLLAKAKEIRARLAQLEDALKEGPHFAGEPFSVVDAVFGPVIRYEAFEAIDDFGFCEGLPKFQRWRRALATRPSVAGAVRPDYLEMLHRFLLDRRSALSRGMASDGAQSIS